MSQPERQPMPRAVLALTHNHDAWIVGGAANPDNANPRDWDVIVPHYEWGKAAHLIPLDATVNSFGGWKFTQNSQVVDVWPGDLGWILQRPKLVWAFHPASGRRFKLHIDKQRNKPATTEAMDTKGGQ